MPGYPENTRYHLASWSGSILAIIGGSIPAIGIARVRVRDEVTVGFGAERSCGVGF